jgi:hypothetical protein
MILVMTMYQTSLVLDSADILTSNLIGVAFSFTNILVDNLLVS